MAESMPYFDESRYESQGITISLRISDDDRDLNFNHTSEFDNLRHGTKNCSHVFTDIYQIIQSGVTLRSKTSRVDAWRQPLQLG